MMAAGGAMMALLSCSSQKEPSPAPGAEAAPAALSPQYEGKLVRRPGSSSEDGKVYVVQQGKKRWIVDASWCLGHGCRIPEDVTEIPADVFAAIPTGDPIQ
jgi:hypothetical protein